MEEFIRGMDNDLLDLQAEGLAVDMAAAAAGSQGNQQPVLLPADTG